MQDARVGLRAPVPRLPADSEQQSPGNRRKPPFKPHHHFDALFPDFVGFFRY